MRTPGKITSLKESIEWSYILKHYAEQWVKVTKEQCYTFWFLSRLAFLFHFPFFAISYHRNIFSPLHIGKISVCPNLILCDTFLHLLLCPSFYFAAEFITRHGVFHVLLYLPQYLSYFLVLYIYFCTIYYILERVNTTISSVTIWICYILFS